MYSMRQWQRWSWDEIFAALSQERGQGEAFEVEKQHVDAPDQAGALRGIPGIHRWDYCFESSDGSRLFVQDRGDHFSAYLDESGPLLVSASPSRLDQLTFLEDPGRMAALGGWLIFLGSLWMVLESSLRQLG